MLYSLVNGDIEYAPGRSTAIHCYLIKALNEGQLMLTGKGGYIRVITFNEEGKQRAIVQKWFNYAKASGKQNGEFLICDKTKKVLI